MSIRFGSGQGTTINLGKVGFHARGTGTTNDSLRSRGANDPNGLLVGRLTACADVREQGDSWCSVQTGDLEANWPSLRHFERFFETGPPD
jgi:hypothetical protein